MLRDVMQRVGTSDGETQIEVLWAPTRMASGEALREAFAPHDTAMQSGATLGDRLCMAFSERFYFHRTEEIIAIGVDEPTIDRQTIDHAFALLDSCDWVIGPAEDGGYYLIGCRAPAFDVAIFRDIEWGTSSVFPTTIARIAEWGNTVAILPRRRDIDSEADLRAFEGGGELGELLRR
jgi:hypothetical protein